MAPCILTLEGGEWSASYPNRFTTKETAPDTHCRSKCPPPQKQIYYPYRCSNHVFLCRPTPVPVTILTTWRISIVTVTCHQSLSMLDPHHTRYFLFTVQSNCSRTGAPQAHIPYVKFVNVMLPILAAFYSSSPSLYKISNWFIFNINYHKLAYIFHFLKKSTVEKVLFNFRTKKKTLLVYEFRKNSKLLKRGPHTHARAH